MTRLVLLGLVVGAQVAAALAWLPKAEPVPFYWEHLLTGGFYATLRPAASGWFWSAAGALTAITLLVMLVPLVIERRKTTLLLVLLTVYGAATHLLLAAVGPRGTDEWMGTLSEPESPSFIAAHVNATGPAAFLRAYVSLQRGDDLPLHCRTHPPGVTLLLAWLSPHLEGYALPALLALLVSASVWPLYALARRLMDDATALVCCIFWLLCPSLALLTPTCTDALTASAAIFVGAAVAAAAARDSRAMLVAAGVLYGVCALLAFFLVPLALVLAAVVAAVGRREHLARSLALVAAGAMVPLVGLYLTTGFSYVDCWWVARAHVLLDIERLNRSIWLIVLDVPAFLAGLGLSSSALLLCGRRATGPLAVVRLATLATLLLLLPFSRGEVERVFLPLMPWCLVAALQPVASLDAEDRRRMLALLTGVAALLACQDLAVQTLFDVFW